MLKTPPVILLEQDNDFYNNDIRSMILAFFPGKKIVEDSSKVKKEDIWFTFYAHYEDKLLEVGIGDSDYFYRYMKGDYRDKAAMRNTFKRACYDVLSEFAGWTLPWGSLTGVRPTKIAMKLLNEGCGRQEIIDYYRSIYEVSVDKAKLAYSVASYEKELMEDINPAKDYCLYIGIPFCPTRCLYCSFTSYPIALYRDKVRDYLDALEKELRMIADTCKDRRLVAVYIGGGTPTSISAEELDRLLGTIRGLFDFSDVREFTVEAGRPDSLLDGAEDEPSSKLPVLKKYGVTRISINPQTMNDDTLVRIGRAHTVAEVVKAFKAARLAGFDNINMDLIAGLPGEGISYMERTLKEIMELAPDSLTVHSLAVKRAANLRQQLGADGKTLESEENGLMIGQDMDAMLGICASAAETMGLVPYYMYRQKNISGNLENVGYSKTGKASIYNVLIMEEVVDIIAAGAGASTKLVRLDAEGNRTRVDRVENVKNVDEYITRIEEMLHRKQEMY